MQAVLFRFQEKCNQENHVVSGTVPDDCVYHLESPK